MKKLIIVAALVAAAVPFASGHADLDGCVAVNGPVDTPYTGSPSCSYHALKPGNIVAVGKFKVEVWWGGRCDVGPADWLRSSEHGDDNGPIGRGGSWEGSIAAGSCARATAVTPGAVVSIGEVGQ